MTLLRAGSAMMATFFVGSWALLAADKRPPQERLARQPQASAHRSDGLRSDDEKAALELARLAQKWRSGETTSPRVDLLISQLRRGAQDSLDTLIAIRRNDGVSVPPGRTVLDLWIDRVAGQRFASESGLFWHTDLDQALRQAAAQRKPVLSLRMLGRLDEDLSCANSRYFRSMLYPDPAIATRLRNDFVLHWNPARDVPVVTIDFGDGRQLRQPLTGNSVHLTLDAGGDPIDAMPGLVSPRHFSQWLEEASTLYRVVSDLSGQQRVSALAEFHSGRARKRRAQSPLAIPADRTVADVNPLDPRWSTLARSQTLVRLSPAAKRVMGRLAPRAEPAMRLAVLKSVAEAPLLRQVRNVEDSVVRDSLFNRLVLQTKIDDWFVSAGTGSDASPDAELMDYDGLTRRIYADVFLMPLDDPWLGLSPADASAALDNGGRLTANRLLREGGRDSIAGPTDERRDAQGRP